MRRAQHRRIHLIVEVDVVAEAALAGEKTQIFLARDGLAYPCTGIR
jgi:hypothetical protein